MTPGSFDFIPIRASREHLAAVGESYGEHMRFAARFGLLMVLGGLACLIHALIPASFQTSGSGMVRKLSATLSDRSTLRRTPDGFRQFLLLLALSCLAAFLPWQAGVEAPLAVTLGLLALAFPLAFLWSERNRHPAEA